MNKDEMRQLHHEAIIAMNSYGLYNWMFVWGRSKRTYGLCVYDTKSIHISKPLAGLNTFEEMWDTVLHEIAHALTPGAGHGPRWKSMCREVGARPEQYRYGNVVPPKWIAEVDCPHVITRDRLASRFRGKDVAWCTPCFAETGERRMVTFRENVERRTHKQWQEFKREQLRSAGVPC